MKTMYVYIMTNSRHTVLYVGVTNNLIRRVEEHKQKTLGGFTAKYNVDKLVYYEYADDEIAAIEREKYLKKCYRKTKDKLISEFNPDWQDLAKLFY
ncbi:MAG: GIY-YIG nuclease family protein [Acetobacter sp.]|nr:GIY-YIG nuclease family protein [Acetobacter sp.]